MTKHHAAYIKWLKAAYLYYIVPGGDSGMHDLAWDHLGRTLYAMRSQLDPAVFPVLHDERYSGGSLFWLRAEQYPDEVRKACGGAA